MDGPWTILELADLAAEALAAARPADSPAAEGPPAAAAPLTSARVPRIPDGIAPRANGRVRDVPNERLIRWYVTVGLVDPPLSRRGRTARYGRRHLLQLVAVKRRQAEGRSLAEVQAELAGATDDALAAIAGVPGIEPGGPHADRPEAGGPEADRPALGRFWARHPGQPALAEPEQASHPAPLAEQPGLAQPEIAQPEMTQPGREVPPGLVRGIRLAPGVVLLLDGAGREPGQDDVTGIVTAARPLLRELADRGLCARTPGLVPGR